jgi:hypothetical protein
MMVSAAIVAVIASRGIVVTVTIVGPPAAAKVRSAAPAIVGLAAPITENLCRDVDGSHCCRQLGYTPKGHGLGMAGE